MKIIFNVVAFPCFHEIKGGKGVAFVLLKWL